MSFGSFKQASGNLNCLVDIWCLWWVQLIINNGRSRGTVTPSLLTPSLSSLPSSLMYFNPLFSPCTDFTRGLLLLRQWSRSLSRHLQPFSKPYTANKKSLFMERVLIDVKSCIFLFSNISSHSDATCPSKTWQLCSLRLLLLDPDGWSGQSIRYSHENRLSPSHFPFQIPP